MSKIFDKLEVFGTGGTTSTSATFAAYNSAGTNSFLVRDDGAVSSRLGYWLDNGGTPEKTIFRNGYYSYGFGAGSLLTNTGNGNLAFGYSVMAGLAGTLSGNGNIGIGGGNMGYLTTGSGNIAIGNGTFSGMYLTGDNNIGIGNNAINDNGGVNNSIALGANAKIMGSNQFVIGSASSPINDLYLGRGVYDITGGLTQGPITIHATGIQGGGVYNNVSTSAMSFTIAGSQGTGTGTGGDIIFKTAPAGASGGSQNSLVEVVRVTSESKVGIGTATPSEKLHISGGTIRINTLNGTEGAGKLAVSDTNGSISFSSTTALGLGTGTVGGTGTTGRIAKWATSSTLTDSLISETGTGVTVNGSIQIYGNVDVLGTASTFNTQTVQTADNNITMNLSGSHVSALYGGITVLSGKADNTSSTWTIDSDGNWSANTSAVTINGARIYSDGQLALNNLFWAASSSLPYIGGTRNTLIGDNDTGTFSIGGNFNNLIGSFQSISLSSGVRNTFIGNYDSINLSSGSDNIGIKSSFSSNISGTLSIGSTPDASNSVFIGNTSNYYPNWYLGLGKSATFAFGSTNMNWYASSVAEGDTDKNATIPIWRFNGSRATGNGSNGDIRFAVSLSGASGALWNPLVDKITVQGNSGFVGINKTAPTVQMDIVGDTRIQDVAGTYGAGKLAVSDSTGKISFSSTTALGISTTASTVTKYTITTTLSNTGTTITHNLNTNYIICAFWDASGNPVIPQYQRINANSIGVSAATTGTYDVVIHG